MDYLTSDFPTPERIREDILAHGFCTYDNAIAFDAVKGMRDFWIPYFLNAGKQNRKALRGNLRLGEENFNSYTDNAEWCLYRNFEFLWNKTHHSVTRALALAIHRVRNRAQGFDENYGLGYSEDCYGIYISTSFYPPATGRLRGHTDGHKDVPILQYMVPITFKGTDYDEGGLCIEPEDNHVVDIDAEVKPGTIIFFDGRMKHSVNAIGAGSRIGRIATFAIPTFFVKQDELPSSLRRLEKLYLGVQRRLTKKASGY